ncbi:hypothetical protein [Dictyobacter formicarum]|uniref:Uncharacterized protein n=1 Tax=Dictyobacter formicarum TaxID=2778368 RepID=A0ABQ3VCE7_9CHLR|nr:hypothetical protein [Dictyobacter formicarum]GHO83807.1 hypothetical protein KSZ_18130 [Dictyobacter formicarum]
MFPYNNQMLSLMYIRMLLKESEQKRIHAPVSNRHFSWRRAGRLSVRKLGILLMRVGGKLVYWGTVPYDSPLPDET